MATRAGETVSSGSRVEGKRARTALATAGCAIFAVSYFIFAITSISIWAFYHLSLKFFAPAICQLLSLSPHGSVASGFGCSDVGAIGYVGGWM